MPYFVDTNLLVSLYIPPDPNKQDQLIEHKEVVKAFEKLKEQKEALYYSDKVLDEVEDVAVKKHGLSPEQAKQLVENIKNDESVKHIDEKIESDAQKKVEQIAKAKDMAEAEKIGLKESIIAEQKKELADKKEREILKADSAITKAVIEAEKAGVSKKVIRNDIEGARGDIDHVATAKAHGLSVLTNNDKHFRVHEDLVVRRPKDIVYDLKPEEIKNVTVGNNPYTKREEYKNTNLAIVETKSGHKADLLVPGQYNDPKDIAKNIAPFNRVEIDKWKSGDRPIMAKLPDLKTLEVGNSLAKSTTQTAETLAKTAITATEKAVDAGAKVADKTLQAAVQVPLKTTSKAIETAAQVAAVPIKAAGKAVETVASVTPAVAKAAIQVAAVPIKAVGVGVEAAGQTVKGVKIVGKGIKDELQGKKKEEQAPQPPPPPPTPKQSQ